MHANCLVSCISCGTPNVKIRIRNGLAIVPEEGLYWMNVARFYAPGDLRIEDVDEPVPSRDEVKIRVRHASICSTDVTIFHYGHHCLAPPRVLGHEVAGEISELGENVDGWTVGDRVQVIAAVPCGDCRTCGQGRMTICPSQTSMGYHYDGGFAEYLIVPRQVLAVDGLNRIPEGVNYAEAAIAEPLACVFNGQQLVRVGSGDSVVVIGAGPTGCLHVRLARWRGADEVFLVDLNQERLDLAGAVVYPDAAVCASEIDPVDAIRKLTNGRGADAVIVAAPSGAAQEDALQMAARGGRISLFGRLPHGRSTIRFDANRVNHQELDIVGANGSSPAQNRQALELISTGMVPVEDLITHRRSLSELHEALALVAGGKAIKVGIEP